MRSNGPEQDTLRHSAKGAVASGFCLLLGQVALFFFIKIKYVFKQS
jgi:hypothetical protein